MRRALLLLSLFNATLTLAAAAEGPSVSGSLFGDFYLSTLGTATSFPQASTIGWLNASSKLNEHSSGYLQAEGRVIESSLTQGRPATTGTFLVREGYLTYSSGRLDLAVGKQIIPWGKTDVISPTDLLTGRDYTLLNPDQEVSRLGATAIKADYTLQGDSSAWTLSTVLVPVAAFSQLLLPPPLLPAGATVGTLSYPTANFSNTEVGVKLAYNRSGWDFALVGFHGWQHLPEYSPVIATTGTVTLVPTPHKINALGVNASWSTGKWIFRADSAYVFTQNNQGNDNLIEPSYWETVLGAEWAFAESWRLQLQLIEKSIPLYADSIGDTSGLTGAALIQEEVVILNSILLDYQRQNHLGATLRLSYKAEKAGWEAELFAMAYYPNGFLIRPKLNWDLTDTLKLTVGAEQYGGPANSQLGAFHPFNSVFTEAKYSF